MAPGDPAGGSEYTPGIVRGGSKYGAIRMVEGGIIYGGSEIVENVGGIVADDDGGRSLLPRTTSTRLCYLFIV